MWSLSLVYLFISSLRYQAWGAFPRVWMNVPTHTRKVLHLSTYLYSFGYASEGQFMLRT